MKMVELEELGETLWNMSRYRLLYRQKTENSHRKMKSRKGKLTQLRQTVRPRQHDRASTMGCLWWLLPDPVLTYLKRCVLVHFWFASFCLGSTELGLLGFFCNSSWSSKPSASFFLLLLGSSYVNLQSKSEQAKTSVIVEIGRKSQNKAY